MNLSTKLIAGFVASVAAGALATLVMVFRLSGIDGQIQQFAERTEPISVIGHELEIHAVEFGLAVLKYVVTPDTQHRDRVDDAGRDVAGFLDQARRIELDPAVHVYIEKFGRDFEAFSVSGVRLMALKDWQVALMVRMLDAMTRLDAVVDDQLPALGELSFRRKAKLNATIKLLAELIELLGWAFLHQTTGSDEILARARAANQHLSTALAEIQGLELQIEEREWVALIGPEIDAIMTTANELMARMPPFQAEIARFVALRRQLNATLDEGLQPLARQGLALAMGRVTETIEAAGVTGLGLAVLAAVIALALAGRLARALRNPLRNLAEAAGLPETVLHEIDSSSLGAIDMIGQHGLFEHALHKRNEELRRQSEMLAAIATSKALSTGNVDQAIRLIVEGAAKVFSVSRVSV